MTTQNLFYANPYDPTKTGFNFTTFESYQAEYDHRHALFGTVEYELQVIDGKHIDLELFSGLHISQANLTEWFEEIRHLTNEEKVGLWFLIRWCGYGLTPALEIVRDGMTIFHGTKENWANEALEESGFFHGVPDHIRAHFDTAKWIHDCEGEGSLREFRFGGETWCANPMAY